MCSLTKLPAGREFEVISPYLLREDLPPSLSGPDSFFRAEHPIESSTSVQFLLWKEVRFWTNCKPVDVRFGVRLHAQHVVATFVVRSRHSSLGYKSVGLLDYKSVGLLGWDGHRPMWCTYRRFGSSALSVVRRVKSQKPKPMLTLVFI